jgi:hypothetical protein
MIRTCVLIDGSVLLHRVFLSKGSSGHSDTTPFTASKGWLHRWKNQFELKNTKIPGEAVSASEKAVAIFPLDLKLIEEKRTLFKASLYL